MKQIFRKLIVVTSSYVFAITSCIGAGVVISEYNDYDYRLELAGVMPTLLIKDTKNIIMPDYFGIAGSTFGPLIALQDDLFHDSNVITHEKTHVKQFYKVVPHVLSLFSEKYQVKAEYEAYRSENYKYTDIEIAEKLKYPGYKISLTKDQILSIIKFQEL